MGGCPIGSAYGPVCDAPNRVRMVIAGRRLARAAWRDGHSLVEPPGGLAEPMVTAPGGSVVWPRAGCSMGPRRIIPPAAVIREAWRFCGDPPRLVDCERLRVSSPA